MLVKGYKGGFEEILSYIDARIRDRPTRFLHCYVKTVPFGAEERTPDWKNVTSAAEFDTLWVSPSTSVVINAFSQSITRLRCFLSVFSSRQIAS
jgi:hypothetical protein